MLALWIILGIIVIFVLLMLMANAIQNSVFGKRCEGNPNLKYFTEEDFEGLIADSVEFPSNKGQILRGKIYRKLEKEPYSALVILVHGMGAGHTAYTTEINTLTDAGYLVLSYDQTGTCLSDGKKMKGLFQGVLDLRYAIDFVKKHDVLKNFPLALVGHSWGGYIVCRALAFSPDVIAVVSLSGFDDEADLFILNAKQSGLHIPFMKPFFYLCTYFKFDWIANKKTSDTIRSTKVPILLLHGDLDDTVPLSNSVAGKFFVDAPPNIKNKIYEEKYHNIYQTKESEAYMREVFGQIGVLKKKHKDKPPKEEIEKIFGGIDYSLITQEDPAVMDTIINFINDNIKDDKE